MASTIEYQRSSPINRTSGGIAVYKCAECGVVFEWPRQWREPHGERRSGCPVCSGAYQATWICLECGRAVSEQYHGYCRACLIKALAQEAGAALAEADVCLLYETAAQLQKRR